MNLGKLQVFRSFSSHKWHKLAHLHYWVELIGDLNGFDCLEVSFSNLTNLTLNDQLTPVWK